jgi:inner membrane protein
MNNTNKQLLKATVIIILIALLMIPTWYISQLVMERKQRKQEITREVSASWANAQTISAPFLQVYYTKSNGGTSKGYIMPTKNNIQSNIKTQNLYRSIFPIPVYESTINMDGVFSKIDIENFKTTYGNITTNNSYLAINITDTKGIGDSASITINNKKYNLTVNNLNPTDGAKSIVLPLSLLENAINADIAYTIQLTVKGTEKFSFIPLATNNNVTIQSGWKDPSFEGKIFTTNKTITKTGFSANWNINGSSLNVPHISEQWVNTSEITTGVNFINSVDSYTKTLRCTKYALLFIALTFAFFYFIEILKNTQIHPIQYILVGLGLVIFYTLLLSISEYIAFDYAYIIASIATILLITYYACSVMQSNKNGLLIGIVLLVLYIFMYVIIQLEETSLLVGSIGLFVALAIIMQVSKKINWNKLHLFQNE